MENNKEYTLAELEAQYEKNEASQRALKVQIEQKYREEERLRQQKLAKDKDARKKEVDDAIANCKKLIKKYMDDYGIYSFNSTNDNDIFNSKFWNLIL